MKKLLMLFLALACLMAAGCDREKYASHRAERSKPKVSVGDNTLMIRRAPAPTILVMPDGSMKIDEIEIPLRPEQKQTLQTMFVQLQILRQNTLAEAPADPNMLPVKLKVPPGMQPIPADLPEQIHEFKDYTASLGNLEASRR